MKKKTLSMLLTGAMTVGMIGSASATVTPQQQSAQTITEFGKSGTTGSANVDLVGEVTNEAVLLSVVVPTRIEFIVGTKEVNPGGSTIADKKGSNATAAVATNYYVFAGLISGTGVVTNNSNVAIKLEMTDLQDNANLTELMDLALASGTLAGGVALQTPFDLSKNYSQPNQSIMLDSHIAKDGGTTELEVVGKAAKGEISGVKYDVHLPNGQYTLTTTLKVSEV